MTKISSIGSVRTLVETLLEKGLTQVILSPGSRNAPFALSFTAIDKFECRSVLDERSAAFIALGMAQESGKPVVICCTSGSALLNYAPAVAEAYYQHIPLIVLSADRPEEWIDQGEGQSIRQRGLLSGAMLQSFHLTVENDVDDQWYNQRLVAEAMEVATSQVAGPVHINVPLREPLYELEERALLPTRCFKRIHVKPQLDVSDRLSLSSIWAGAHSILILVSQGKHPAGLIDQLRNLNNDPRIAIVTETTANVQHLGLVCAIDRTIESFIGTEGEVNYVPQLLITIGENIISKKLKTLLRRHRNEIHYHWHLADKVMDTFQTLTHVLPVRVDEFLGSMSAIDSVETESQFGVEWRSRFFLNEQLHEDFLSRAPYSDLTVFERIVAMLPDGANVQMGNSSVVRYFQLFNQLQNVTYHGNRGVSGIEGCVSTAVGVALNAEGLVVHVSGDHAFRYDSNALASARPDNLRIIVINNGGGNIFRIIPGPGDHSASDQFIEAQDDRSVQKLIEYHGAEYLQAKDFESLENALEVLMLPTRNTCTVLEIFTPRELSPQVLSEYFASMK